MLSYMILVNIYFKFCLQLQLFVIKWAEIQPQKKIFGKTESLRYLRKPKSPLDWEKQNLKRNMIGLYKEQKG